MFEYAKTKGDFDKLKAELSETYKNVKGANIDNELTSSLVGQYVFSDTEFVQNLSKHRNIFQKVYDEIKHLYKMATAGSKEARQLERVKRTFEKVYQNSADASTENKYMITGIKGVKNDIKINAEDNVIIDRYKEAHDMKKQGYSNEDIRQKTGWFQDKENMWKFEISDNKAKLKVEPQKNTSYKLAELLEHDDLYEMYPNLKNIKVKFKNIKNNIDPKTKKQNIVAGYYNTLTNTISINNKLINIQKGKNEILNTLLHETQHIIQKTEGFNHGYPKNDVETYNINLGEQEAFDTENRKKLNYNQRRNIAPVSSLIEKNNQMNYNTNRGANNEKVNSDNKRFRLVQDTSEFISTTSIDQRRNKQNNTRNQELENSSFSIKQHKQQQFDIIQNSNPANDDLHTWIRNIDDIKTFEETLQDDDWSSGDDFDPDYTWNMAQEALDSGNITVYSSYPIEPGIFVTPSKMEAKSYSGNGKVYSKNINLQDVAWIDPTQGQYAKVNDTQYSLNNDNLVPLQDKEIQLQDVRNENRPIAPLPANTKTIIKNANIQNNSEVVRTINNNQENIKEINPNKTLNPTEIAQIKPENASTTPKINNIKVSTGDGKSHFFDNIKDKVNMLSEDSKAS